MENSKDEVLAELLAELVNLGVHPSGRKIRADKGKTHEYTETRSDKGTKRDNYNNETAAYGKQQFNKFVRAHRDPNGGDTLTRDANMIFPPNTTHYYKTIRVKPGSYVNKRTGVRQERNAYSYVSSVARPNHPEELRWRWWFRAYKDEVIPAKQREWAHRICKWYFIELKDLDYWTYNEWAWAYVYAIGGHENRLTDKPIILDYNKFLAGEYTMPEFDNDGRVLWPK